MPVCAAICDDCGAFLPGAPGAGLCLNCVAVARTTPMPALRVMAPPMEADGASPVPGHEVLEVIGTGGMGSVHRARQESLQRDVAVKIIRVERANEEETERFLREARVLAQLDHPNIVPIYDSGVDAEGRCFYTMKMVRGRTLKAILLAVCKGSEEWTLERLLGVFRKVCDAVAFAHARGVLHRDLKPENIMVGEFGEVLVMDWGLAGEIKSGAHFPAPCTVGVVGAPRGRALESDVELTMDGIVLGTPQYMSPEQANACTDLDVRCDVYMLGGLLYSILSLRPPVRVGTLDEMLESVRSGRIEPFAAVPQMTRAGTAEWRIPPALAAVVRKAMALEREDRFPTVGALSEDVDAHLAGYATSAEQLGLAGQLWLLIKRHRTVSAALLVLLLVSAGFVIQLIESERRANHLAGFAQNKAAETRVALAQARTALANSAYVANDPEQMRVALAGVPDDLRDTHWRYLNARTDERQSQFAWNGSGFLIGSAPHPSQPGVFTAATSASGQQVVTFDAKTGKVLREFQQRGGWVRGIAYSPDGKLIALSRIQNQGISIHNAEDGTELIHWPAGWADSVTFLPDGKRLLQSDQSGCHLWEVATGRAIWKSPFGMTHLLLPDGQRIAAVSETSLRLLSAEDGRVLAKYPLKAAFPISASISPDGELLVVALANGQITGVRTGDGTTVFEVPGGENGKIERTGFTPDGQRFITVATFHDSTQSVQLRDIVTGSALRHLRGGTGNIESLTLHPLSGDLLITGSCSATWALPRVREPRWRLVAADVVGGFFGSDDVFLAPAAASTSLAAIDLRTEAVCWNPTQQAFSISATSFDGLTGVTQLAARGSGNGGAERRFQILRADGPVIRETAKASFRTDAHDLTLNCDGTRFAVSGSWGGLAAYLTETGGPLPKIDDEDIGSTMGLTWHGSDPSRLVGVFTRFGRRGMPASQEWLVAWNADTGQRVAAVRHATALNCLATEPGGSRLAEAGDDQLVRIRDANTLAMLLEFRAHDGPINAIAWNPKRPIIATGSTDRSVRLWNAETGQLIEELHIGLREPEALHFSPSGRRLACVTPGEKTLIWELE